MQEKEQTIAFPITCDPTFKEVFSDPAITRQFLESLLNIRIQSITIVPSAEIRPYITSRWAVLDIKVTDEQGRMYDIEMQKGHYDEIGLRYRDYGFSLDSRMIQKGMNFNEIKTRIVIFICTEDPFHENRRQYTFHTTCEETGMILEDRAELICLNIQGTTGRINVDIEAFLTYAKDGTADGSALVAAIDAKVKELNADEEFRRESMTYEQKLQSERNYGFKEGREEGKEEERKAGILKMVHALKKLGQDDAQIKSMLKEEYGATDEECTSYLKS